jgi:hypothetical protein
LVSGNDGEAAMNKLPTPVNPLEAAYLASRYLVFVGLDRPWEIRCGSPSPDLDQLLDHHGVGDWAFLTACNPRSKRLPDDENRLRMAELQKALQSAGYIWLSGSGEGSEGSWPPEPSLLVLGIPLTKALQVAHSFDQHAIVAGRRGEPARLVWVTEKQAPHRGPSTVCP